MGARLARSQRLFSLSRLTDPYFLILSLPHMGHLVKATVIESISYLPGKRHTPLLARYIFRDGGWLVFHCAQRSHPPTHWQIFFTRPTLRLLRNRFPGTCHLPWRGPSTPPLPLVKGVAEAALCCAHRTRTVSPCAFCEQEGHQAAPSSSSEATRCASTEDHRASIPSSFSSTSEINSSQTWKSKGFEQAVVSGDGLVSERWLLGGAGFGKGR
jgi:hypothetical protein